MLKPVKNSLRSWLNLYTAIIKINHIVNINKYQNFIP
jgi:hypothetical protein